MRLQLRRVDLPYVFSVLHVRFFFQMVVTPVTQTKAFLCLATLWTIRRCSSLVMTESGADIFVYGTLKKLQPNHHHLLNETLGQATFEGPFRTVERWPLTIATKANLPCLLELRDFGKKSLPLFPSILAVHC